MKLGKEYWVGVIAGIVSMEIARYVPVLTWIYKLLGKVVNHE